MSETIHSSTSQNPCLDPDTIEALRELGGEEDPGLFQELVQIFVSDSDKRVPDLQKAANKQDWTAAARIAHSFKSSSANFGANRLTEMCQKIEVAANQSPESVPAVVASVPDEYERVRQTLVEMAAIDPEPAED